MRTGEKRLSFRRNHADQTTAFHPAAHQSDRMSNPRLITSDCGNPLEGYGARLPRKHGRGHDTGPEHATIRTADYAGEETTLIVGTLSYAGTGWQTTGDALLANTAADQARKRREAGREDLACEYAAQAGERQAA